MKAVCTKTMIAHTINGATLIEKGDVVEYTVEERKFIVSGSTMHSTIFFNHFKVVEGKDKMSYSDFEYILCNYIFTTSVLFPEEYNGIRHLIIQNWNNTILITANRTETIIRVSFEDTQEKYSSYEEALNGIKNHERK